MKYVPFLKLKQNECLALRRMTSECHGLITPFFDIPREKDMDEAKYISRVSASQKFVERTLKETPFDFYLDVFDVPLNINVQGRHIYEYALSELSNFNPIPVVGLDRDIGHIVSAKDYLIASGNKRVAIRLLEDDLGSYDFAAMQIDSVLGDVVAIASEVDLIIDLRLLVESKIGGIIANAIAFIKKSIASGVYRRVIVSSSSIPPSISEIVKPQSEKYFARHEWPVWNAISGSFPEALIYGDYTVVSPDFVEFDLAVELMRTVQTPRVIYTGLDTSYAVRGGALKTHGDSQHYVLSDKLIATGMFRHGIYSQGDKYIESIQKRIAKSSGNAGSWIAATVNAHMTFLLKNL